MTLHKIIDATLPDRLRRVVDTIVDEVAPLQIVLFGSQARGDATDASDVDLLITDLGSDS